MTEEKREIKFRAWDERNKIMHNDFQFIKSGDKGNDWIIFISDKFPLTEHKTNPFENPNPYFAQQLKVMQFTGLKDKNGKEIYEGDIVRWNEQNWPIFWSNRLGRYMMGNQKACEEVGIGSIEVKGIGKVRCCKVIGNIYENPELLKEQL